MSTSIANFSEHNNRRAQRDLSRTVHPAGTNLPSQEPESPAMSLLDASPDGVRRRYLAEQARVRRLVLIARSFGTVTLDSSYSTMDAVAVGARPTVHNLRPQSPAMSMADADAEGVRRRYEAELERVKGAAAAESLGSVTLGSTVEIGAVEVVQTPEPVPLAEADAAGVMRRHLAELERIAAGLPS